MMSNLGIKNDTADFHNTFVYKESPTIYHPCPTYKFLKKDFCFIQKQTNLNPLSRFSLQSDGNRIEQRVIDSSKAITSNGEEKTKLQSKNQSTYKSLESLDDKNYLEENWSELIIPVKVQSLSFLNEYNVL